MYTDREEFEGWMERIMERFDRTEKLLERVLKKNNTLDGEEVLDNQDLCLLLKVGIRTLQRYRAIGVLPYFTISGKVFYRTKDVHEFIRTRFADVEERAAKRKEKEAGKRKGAGKGGCSRENDIFLTVLLVDEALPDREIRRGYCFVIREVSVSLFARSTEGGAFGQRRCRDIRRFMPGLETGRIDIHIVRSLNVLE